MRVLAEMLRNKDGWGFETVQELLAAQVVAVASYEGVRLTSREDINAAVLKVAGYPMHYPVPDGPFCAGRNLATAVARRVAELIKLPPE